MHFVEWPDNRLQLAGLQTTCAQQLPELFVCCSPAGRLRRCDGVGSMLRRTFDLRMPAILTAFFCMPCSYTDLCWEAAVRHASATALLGAGVCVLCGVVERTVGFSCVRSNSC